MIDGRLSIKTSKRGKRELQVLNLVGSCFSAGRNPLEFNREYLSGRVQSLSNPQFGKNHVGDSKMMASCCDFRLRGARFKGPLKHDP